MTYQLTDGQREMINEATNGLRNDLQMASPNSLLERDLITNALSKIVMVLSPSVFEAGYIQGLEEAAKLCDGLGQTDAPTDRLIGYDNAAQDIRALKDKP